MSQVSWYPRTAPEQRSFFWRTFPMFVILLVFFLFGLDWIGAYAFLEVLVRDNSAWLLRTIWGYDSFMVSYFERIDQDPLTGGIVRFYEDFPGIRLDDYPRTLLIIRACTGMEAGALLMALIIVTPAKWQNKTIAHITNLLMMHIGNTFRVAFHFWYTQHLYVKFRAVGMSYIDAADKAFGIAHDSLSKVFGFIGIVIFTLVIERTGVRIVSTFGAWIDGLISGTKRITGKIDNNAYYFDGQVSHSKLATADTVDPIVATRVENLAKVNFYPRDEIQNNKWTFFTRTFFPFIGVALAIIGLGLLPWINMGIGMSSDSLATSFGAILYDSGVFNFLWWKSSYEYVANVNFITNVVSSGFLLFGIITAAIIFTPGKWKNKGIALGITPVLIFPLNILRLGFQKWAIWKTAHNSDLRTNNPLLYLNVADMLTTWLPLFFWIALFVSLVFICRKLNVKIFATMWAWLNQLMITLGWLVGLRTKPGKEVELDEGTLAKGKTTGNE